MFVAPWRLCTARSRSAAGPPGASDWDCLVRSRCPCGTQAPQTARHVPSSSGSCRASNRAFSGTIGFDLIKAVAQSPKLRLGATGRRAELALLAPGASRRDASFPLCTTSPKNQLSGQPIQHRDVSGTPITRNQQSAGPRFVFLEVSAPAGPHHEATAAGKRTSLWQRGSAPLLSPPTAACVSRATRGSRHPSCRQKEPPVCLAPASRRRAA